ARLKECDLVATAVVKGALIQAVGTEPDVFKTAGGNDLSRKTLLQSMLPVTFTCYPPGNAQRLL
ncbi:MAG TPA: hypothetical protein VFM46_08605, partial [Pseudomonadales bacterium]|nr:hypothetical protein [Pseudomonadales bacterium]